MMQGEMLASWKLQTLTQSQFCRQSILTLYLRYSIYSMLYTQKLAWRHQSPSITWLHVSRPSHY